MNNAQELKGLTLGSVGLTKADIPNLPEAIQAEHTGKCDCGTKLVATSNVLKCPECGRIICGECTKGHLDNEEGNTIECPQCKKALRLPKTTSGNSKAFPKD